MDRVEHDELTRPGAVGETTLDARAENTPGEDPRELSPAAAAAQRAALFERLGLETKDTRFGRFSVVDKLGEGGMGVVLDAHDPDLGRRVALKLLAGHRVDARARARLVREARSLAKLSHPNIVQVFEVGEFEHGSAMAGMPYLAMELVDGATLREWIRTPARRRDSDDDDAAPAPPDRLEVLKMFLQVGEGLAAAHEAGVVHRDFKPENVLVGDDGRPRIADFGLAHGGTEASDAPGDDTGAQDIALTRTGALMGTPAYMSPEQWDGKVADARSDQFSFCVALFEAIYGRPPFPAKNAMALRERVLERDPVEIEAADRVPGELHAAILRGLSRDPDARWPELGPLLDAVRETLSRVQPGLFASSPAPIVRVIAPIVVSVPVLWWILELTDVVAYSSRAWAAVSAAQLAVMGSVVALGRSYFARLITDRRLLVMPAVVVPLLLAHRALAFATGSFDLLFAYDFLALAGVALGISLLLEKGMWPMVVLALTLAGMAAVFRAQAGHVWLAFGMLAPITVGVSASLAQRRRPRVLLRGGGSLRTPRSAPKRQPRPDSEPLVESTEKF